MKPTNRSTITAFIAMLTLLLSVCIGTTSQVVSADSSSESSNHAPLSGKDKSRFPLLSRYAIDLTELARRGRLGPVNRYGKGIRRTLTILNERSSRNPLLIENSIYMDAASIVCGLAQEIASNDAPENLQGKLIFSLRLDRLSAGINDPEEFVVRLKSVLSEAENSRGKVILFIEDLHQMV